MRKTRPPQSPIDKLPPEKRAVLHGWFRENLILREVRDRIEKELGLAVSIGSVSNYYRRWGRECIAARKLAESTIMAGGIEVIVNCEQPGEIRLSIRPIPQREAEAVPSKS